MAILNILHYPDPRLRTRAQPVERVDDGVRQLIDDLFDTMYDAPGIGLAATQVDVHRRVLVVDVSEDGNAPMAFVNPQIVTSEGWEEMQEGCLSVPEYFDTVQRAERIVVRALDRDGVPFEMQADGLLAVCIQHEIDHLDGRLFVDYLSELKRKRLRKRMDKQARSSPVPPAAGERVS
jgi:peptide deformylase